MAHGLITSYNHMRDLSAVAPSGGGGRAGGNNSPAYSHLSEALLNRLDPDTAMQLYALRDWEEHQGALNSGNRRTGGMDGGMGGGLSRDKMRLTNQMIAAQIAQMAAQTANIRQETKNAARREFSGPAPMGVGGFGNVSWSGETPWSNAYQRDYMLWQDSNAKNRDKQDRDYELKSRSQDLRSRALQDALAQRDRDLQAEMLANELSISRERIAVERSAEKRKRAAIQRALDILGSLFS